MIETTELPHITKKRTNLIQELALFAKSFGESTVVPNVSNFSARLGMNDDLLELNAFLDEFRNEELLCKNPDFTITNDVLTCKLTYKYWSEHRKLQDDIKTSNLCFLALKMDPAHQAWLLDIVKPIVAKTGFDLKTVGCEEKTGNITDKIKVDIRRSRFFIADITHGNRGAYFEAGFAEGLGKKVIYICNDTEFESNHTIAPDLKPIHFDVAQQLILKYKKTDKSVYNFEDRLKATIRNSITGAKLED
jgi:hypothetical protein